MVSPSTTRDAPRSTSPLRLAQGWQYVVYDLGNGRVRKTPRSFLSLYPAVLRAPRTVRPRQDISAAGVVRHLRSEARMAISRLASKGDRVDPALFGNPVFFADGAYEQDVVVPLGEILDQIGTNEQSQVIRGYIQLQHACWTHGLADPGFDFAINAGYDRHGRVVQIDLGELQSDRDVIARAIAQKIWLIQDSFTKRRGNADFVARFEEMMAREITCEKLRSLWATRDPS